MKRNTPSQPVTPPGFHDPFATTVTLESPLPQPFHRDTFFSEADGTTRAERASSPVPQVVFSEPSIAGSSALEDTATYDVAPQRRPRSRKR